jgi:hypothetical protein
VLSLVLCPWCGGGQMSFADFLRFHWDVADGNDLGTWLCACITTWPKG